MIGSAMEGGVKSGLKEQIFPFVEGYLTLLNPCLIRVVGPFN